MKGLRIEIDDKSGFCFGVVRAISEAEKALAEGSTVYSLGDIVLDNSCMTVGEQMAWFRKEFEQVTR